MSEQAIKRIINVSDLTGRTVSNVIRSPAGELGSAFDAVLIFSDKSFAALGAEGYESDAEAHLAKGRDWTIEQILSPYQMFMCGLINQGQHDYLVEQAKSRDEAKKQFEIEVLKQKLRDLGEDA